jgi:hypothetical protein
MHVVLVAAAAAAAAAFLTLTFVPFAALAYRYIAGQD